MAKRIMQTSWDFAWWVKFFNQQSSYVGYMSRKVYAIHSCQLANIQYVMFVVSNLTVID